MESPSVAPKIDQGNEPPKRRPIPPKKQPTMSIAPMGLCRFNEIAMAESLTIGEKPPFTFKNGPLFSYRNAPPFVFYPTVVIPIVVTHDGFHSSSSMGS
jgi:hypothetical protein